MSNNTSLWAITDSGKEFISEIPYVIPFGYLLLCSANPQQVPPVDLVEEPPASDPNFSIRGDARGGLEAVIEFLDSCQRRNNEHPVLDAAELAALKTTFEQQLQDLSFTHFHLEIWDIAQMFTTDFPRYAGICLAQIADIKNLSQQRLEQIFDPAYQAYTEDESDELPIDWVDFDSATDEEYLAFLAQDQAHVDASSSPSARFEQLALQWIF